MRSLLPQHEVQSPAAADVRARVRNPLTVTAARVRATRHVEIPPPQVPQQFLAGAAGLLQGVGQDGEVVRVEGAVGHGAVTLAGGAGAELAVPRAAGAIAGRALSLLPLLVGGFCECDNGRRQPRGVHAQVGWKRSAGMVGHSTCLHRNLVTVRLMVRWETPNS